MFPAPSTCTPYGSDKRTSVYALLRPIVSKYAYVEPEGTVIDTDAAPVSPVHAVVCVSVGLQADTIIRDGSLLVTFTVTPPGPAACGIRTYSSFLVPVVRSIRPLVSLISIACCAGWVRTIMLDVVAE